MMSISAPSYSALRIIVITNNCEQRVHKYKSDEYLMDHLQSFACQKTAWCVYLNDNDHYSDLSAYRAAQISGAV